MRRPWSLRTRLVLAAIGLVAVVSAVIATVTAIALSSYLYHQLDLQLRGVSFREGPADDGLSVLDKPGLPYGTLAARLDADGDVTEAAVIETTDPGRPVSVDDRLTELGAKQIEALDRVAGSRQADNVELPGYGEYRVVTLRTPDGDILVGLPTAPVTGTVRTLVLVECLVAGAGLIAAGIAATVVVRMALRPLRRVAATATRVSRLPLSHGEVSLPDRVPEPDTDTRTEVGQVGAALNRLLGHVGSALSARHDSEQRVRRFVADASHELRTPLASIRGYAELTRRGNEEVGPDTRHALRRIESESTRMTGLVEDLLLLARLDSGRPMELAEVDLTELMVDVFADAHAADLAVGDGAGSREQRGASRHHWVLELPDEPITVRADRQRLHQALANILANARVHTPPGTTVTGRIERAGDGPGEDVAAQVEPSADDSAPRSRASAEPSTTAGPGQPVTAGPRPSADDSTTEPEPLSADGGPVAARPGPAAAEHTDAGTVIVIHDDGPGVPPHLLPHVFERFSRGDSSRSRSAGSTGLGLAIVAAIAAAHHGDVTIASQPGATTVRLRLP